MGNIFIKMYADFLQAVSFLWFAALYVWKVSESGKATMQVESALMETQLHNLKNDKLVL